jgi:hypothetical protein
MRNPVTRPIILGYIIDLKQAAFPCHATEGGSEDDVTSD